MAATYPGHQGANIIRPSKGHSEYVIVIRFSDIKSAKTWIESTDRKNMVEKIKDALVDGDLTDIKSGIDFWFTPESEARPPAWKQWLITTSVIAPLTMIVPLAFKPVFAAVPFLGTFGVSHILIASAIVGLVTFLIMPRYVHLLRHWLYQK